MRSIALKVISIDTPPEVAGSACGKLQIALINMGVTHLVVIARVIANEDVKGGPSGNVIDTPSAKKTPAEAGVSNLRPALLFLCCRTDFRLRSSRHCGLRIP